MLKVSEKFVRYMKTILEKNTKINEKGCWIWQKNKSASGYGKTQYYENKIKYYLRSHRAAWMVYNGDIPSNLIVCHKCDVSLCCNPDHLFLGTFKENTQDMIRKKRDIRIKGEQNYNSILNEEIVLKMREMKKQGLKVKVIAEHFNIKYFTCLDAISGRNWSHV